MILNEKLFESKTLTERFSPNMPQWLKDRLVYVKYATRGNTFNPTKRDAIKQNTKQAYATYGARNPDTPLFQEFLNKGIDLNTVDILDDGDIPDSSRDPRLKEPYIPIFLLEDDNDGETQVYAKGINDNEECILDGDLYGKLFKFISSKQLLNAAKAFCYIDTSNIDNYGVKEKRTDRAEYKVSELGNPFTRYSAEEQQRIQRYDRNKIFDKSGHLVDPDRLIDRLKDYKAKNPAKTLEKLYRRLSNIKNDFAQLYLNTDINEYDSNQDYRDVFFNYNNLNEKLKNIVSDYNNFVREVNIALNNTAYSEEEKVERIQYVFDMYFSRINNNINDLEKKAERVLSVDLDWD